LDLEAINGLGLPGWAVTIAALLWMLRSLGVIDPVVSYFQGKLTFRQEQEEARAAAEQSEQVALWAQTTRLQSQALSQNELLLDYIITDIRENIEKILEEVRQGKYVTRQIEAKLSLMVQVISELYDRRQEGEPDTVKLDQNK